MKIKNMNWFLLWLLPHDVIAITLAPFAIYLRDDEAGTAETITHESIHWKQQTEMLVIFFYLWYIIEWFIKYLYHLSGAAYYALSFEREAYTNDDNSEYLTTRKHYAWFKYIKNKILWDRLSNKK